MAAARLGVSRSVAAAFGAAGVLEEIAARIGAWESGWGSGAESTGPDSTPGDPAPAASALAAGCLAELDRAAEAADRGDVGAFWNRVDEAVRFVEMLEGDNPPTPPDGGGRAQTGQHPA